MKVVFQTCPVDIRDKNSGFYISSNYKMTFEDMGHKVRLFYGQMPMGKLFRQFRPDIFITCTNKEFYTRYIDFDFLKKYRKSNDLKILCQAEALTWKGQNIYDKEKGELVRSGDLGNIFFGYIEPEAMEAWEERFGLKYNCVLNAANKLIHFPVDPVEKYKCDIAFVGNWMTTKIHFFKNFLLPLKKKYNVKIYGKKWKFYERVQDKIFRTTGMGIFKPAFKKLIPNEGINEVCSSAKICVNIHQDLGPGWKLLDLNERTFHIPLCGGFEMCTPVWCLRKHFKPNEIVMAENEKDWFEKIEFYLENDTEREKIIKRGQKKVNKHHTYHNRVKQLLELK